MKVLNYLVVLCFAVFAAACSDDEPKNTLDAVSGSYVVTSSMSVMGSATGEPATATVVVEAKNGKASIITPAMGEGKMSLPELTISNVDVIKKSETTYTFKKEKTEVTAGEMVYKIEVDETSQIADGKMNMKINVQPGAMPMPIVISFVSK